MFCTVCGAVKDDNGAIHHPVECRPISERAMQKRQSKDWQIPEPTKVEPPQPPGLWERKLELD